MRLKEIRKARKLRQLDVAEAVNCSQAVYSRYENEERQIPNDVLVSLAAFYGVSVDMLLGIDDNPVEVNEAKVPPPPQDPPAWGQYGPETRKILREILGKLEGMDNEQLKAVEVVVDALGKKK